jgi:hypothetical protein
LQGNSDWEWLFLCAELRSVLIRRCRAQPG